MTVRVIHQVRNIFIFRHIIDDSIVTDYIAGGIKDLPDGHPPPDHLLLGMGHAQFHPMDNASGFKEVLQSLAIHGIVTQGEIIKSLDVLKVRATEYLDEGGIGIQETALKVKAKQPRRSADKQAAVTGFALPQRTLGPLLIADVPEVPDAAIVHAIPPIIGAEWKTNTLPSPRTSSPFYDAKMSSYKRRTKASHSPHSARIVFPSIAGLRLAVGSLPEISFSLI
jgi:hypothetical protein